jgi:iron complex transport system substrate-binding protein
MRALKPCDRRQLLGGVAALASSLSLFTGREAPAASSSAARIVSVGGALTETLFALGAQADLVGVDTTSFYPDAAKKLPSVGYQRTLSAEGVLSLAPTLLVATEDAGPPAVLRQIEAARVPIHVLDSAHSFEGVLARTLRLAALTGRASAGSALVERLQADWLAARERVAVLAPRDAAKAPRVLFVMAQSLNQLRVAGKNTGADTLIGYAGARNAFDGAEGYKPLTPEAAVAAAPDVIVATDQGLAAVGGAANLLRAPGLAQTPAGRSQRVVSIEILLALGFGPRLPLAVTTLAEALHRRGPGNTPG